MGTAPATTLPWRRVLIFLACVCFAIGVILSFAKVAVDVSVIEGLLFLGLVFGFGAFAV
jgi:hypothetical protein